MKRFAKITAEAAAVMHDQFMIMYIFLSSVGYAK